MEQCSGLVGTQENKKQEKDIGMSANGVQKIIDEIKNRAEKQANDILADARQKVESRMQQARQSAEEEKRSVVTRGEQDARRESQRILAEARIKARREKVQAQERLVLQSFEKARAGLRELAEAGTAGDASYPAVLENLIVESAVSANTDSLEVLVNERDREILNSETLQKISRRISSGTGKEVELKLSDTAFPCSGGVVVRSTDGSIQVNNTFESRIERYRDAIRTHVAHELFPQE